MKLCELKFHFHHGEMALALCMESEVIPCAGVALGMQSPRSRATSQDRGCSSFPRSRGDRWPFGLLEINNNL